MNANTNNNEAASCNHNWKVTGTCPTNPATCTECGATWSGGYIYAAPSAQEEAEQSALIRRLAAMGYGD